MYLSQQEEKPYKRLDENTLNQMVAQIDHNCDGKISEKEFEEWFLSGQRGGQKKFEEKAIKMMGGSQILDNLNKIKFQKIEDTYTKMIDQNINVGFNKEEADKSWIPAKNHGEESLAKTKGGMTIDLQASVFGNETR